MPTMTALAIIVRHVEADGPRGVCRACGLPWPCDVRRLVDAMTAEARVFATAPGPSAGPCHGSAHTRRAATRVPIA